MKYRAQLSSARSRRPTTSHTSRPLAHPRSCARPDNRADVDSAAWTAYLAPGGFSLPHLKVYGADGALIFERTAPPPELLREVEALLQGTAQVPR